MATLAGGAMRPKRWGEGLDAPAAGVRIFVPQGFEVRLTAEEAMQKLGCTPEKAASAVAAGRRNAATAPNPMPDPNAAVLHMYTDDSSLYGKLCYTMRTPHTKATPTDTQLKNYTEFIVYLQVALTCLPAFSSSVHGMVYRGLNVLLKPDTYAVGKNITWQAFSSATKKQLAITNFLTILPGFKLHGSAFVINSITGRDIHHFSRYPDEGEVLFLPNSHFKVERILTEEADKLSILPELCAYKLEELHVYILTQTA